MDQRVWEHRAPRRGTCRNRQAHSSREPGHRGSCSHRLQEIDVGGVSPAVRVRLPEMRGQGKDAASR